MMTAMAVNTSTWVTNVEFATVPSVMTMISAESMKSVRTAPLILSFSIDTRSAAGSMSACISSASCAASSALL